MDKAQKDIITANRVELVENITVKDGLYSQLLQKKVLSQRSINRIKGSGVDEQQVEELLNELMKRDCFELFCQALIDDTQVDVVKKYLKPPASQTVFTPTPAASEPSPIQTTNQQLVGSLQPPTNQQPTGPQQPSSVITNKQLTPSFMNTNENASLPLQPSMVSTDCASGMKRANPSPPQSATICIRESDNEHLIVQYVPPCKAARQEEPSQLNNVQGEVPETFEDDETRYHLKHFIADKPIPISPYIMNNPQILSNPNIIDPQRYITAFLPPAGRLQGVEHLAARFLSLPTNSVTVIPEGRNMMDTQSIRKLLQPQNPLLQTQIINNKESSFKRIDQESFPRFNVTVGQLGVLSASKTTVQETLGPGFNTDDAVDNISMYSISTPTLSTKLSEQPRLNDKTDITRVMTEFNEDKFHLPASFEEDMSSMDLPDGCVNVKVEATSKQFFLQNFKKSYPMKQIPRGLALIINVDEVEGKPPRKGTNFDRDNLCSLLTQLHFNIMCYNDQDGLTALDIVNKLKTFSRLKDHETSDACFICLLSHGEEGYIFGTDGKRIPLEEIFMLFGNTNCKGLIGKPKIFIIQACRGGMYSQVFTNSF
ncbi:Caspase-2 [Biomphalaria glabrata]|nr:cell death protein 3; partial [Biomphalaria glabrata]